MSDVLQFNMNKLTWQQRRPVQDFLQDKLGDLMTLHMSCEQTEVICQLHDKGAK